MKHMCTSMHVAMQTHKYTQNNKGIANIISNSEAAEVDQILFSFHTQHKRHVFVAERRGSYNSAFCFILVKMWRKTREECFKKNRHIKHTHQKDTSKYPSGIKFDSLFLL